MSGEISTGDVAGVGIAIGPGARATVQVLGDLHYYPVTLRAPLREALRTLLDDSTRVFAGREEPLLEIAEFLRRPEGGYLAITAPAGFGKTALAAALARSAEERLAYHFFTPLYGESSLSEEFFLRSLVEQLAGWYGHAEEVPADIFELRALYQRFLARPLDRPGAILIDGLDEVSDWLLAPYLPRQLGAGLHVVVTVRDVGQDWAADFGLQHAAELPLHGLTRAQVAAVLAAAGADRRAGRRRDPGRGHPRPRRSLPRAAVGRGRRGRARNPCQCLGPGPLPRRVVAGSPARQSRGRHAGPLRHLDGRARPDRARRARAPAPLAGRRVRGRRLQRGDRCRAALRRRRRRRRLRAGAPTAARVHAQAHPHRALRAPAARFLPPLARARRAVRAQAPGGASRRARPRSKSFSTSS